MFQNVTQKKMSLSSKIIFEKTKQAVQTDNIQVLY